MIPTMPNRFADKSNLDLDALNESFRTVARVVKICSDRRYTYWCAVFDLAGVADTDDVVLRTLALRRPGAANGIEVIGVEAYTYGGAAVTGTVSCSDTSFPGFTFTTSATATEESYGATDCAVSIPSNAADVTFTIAFSGAYTISDGALLIHFRSDRGDQGDNYPIFEPSALAGGDWPYNSETTTAPTQLEDTMQNLADVVADQAAAEHDLRCQIFVARNLAPGASAVFTIPGGEGMPNDFRVEAYVVAAATNTGRVTVNDHTSTVNQDVVGTGVTSRAHGGRALTRGGGTDPLDSAHDTIVTLKNQAGAANLLLIYAVVWWD